MSAARPQLAVLGTGRMGAPIASNLLAAGFAVSVWNRTRSRAAGPAGDGAWVGSTPAQAAAQADIVFTMLTDGAAVEQVMSGPEGAAAATRPGAVWIQMSTVGVEWTHRLAELAEQHGLRFVDAPVSGSDGPAREGTLLVLASGADDVRAEVQPVFEAIGRRTLWLGPAGNGSALKLALNTWLASLVEGMAEVLALTDALQVDPRVFVDTLADLPLSSPFAIAKGNAMIAHDFAPGFALRHALKDVGLALDAANERGVELPVTASLQESWEDVVAAGHADDDVSVVFESNKVLKEAPR